MMANGNSNGRRNGHGMSARQGALIIKHLETIDARTKAAASIAKAQGDKTNKLLERIADALERRVA